MKKTLSLLLIITAIIFSTGCEITFNTSSSSFSDDNGFTTTDDAPVITKIPVTTYKPTKALSKVQCNKPNKTMQGMSGAAVVTITYDPDTKEVTKYEEETQLTTYYEDIKREAKSALLDLSHLYNKITGVTMSVHDKSLEINIRNVIVYDQLSVNKAKELITDYNENNYERVISDTFLYYTKPMQLNDMITYLTKLSYTCNLN